MHKIIRLEFYNEYYKTVDFTNLIEHNFSSIIEIIYSEAFFEKSIKEIIITDDIENEIKKQAEKFINNQISKERGLLVAAKILTSPNLKNPEYIIIYPASLLSQTSHPLIQFILEPILSIHATQLPPFKILYEKLVAPAILLNDYIELAAFNWCKAAYVYSLLKHLKSIELRSVNHNLFLTSFKRKLKKSLFDYNNDHFDHQIRLNEFWFSYWNNIISLFLRFIESPARDIQDRLKESEPCIPIIQNIIEEIQVLCDKIVLDGDFDITQLKKLIIQFSANFDIHLKEQSEGKFYIEFSKNPKDYFINEIIETEPRLVCYLDILGFKQMISEYDSDLTSTLLQDIHESFDLAKTIILKNEFLSNKESVKHLKYQTFSDNICISIPYFDNESDFIINFHLLSVYIRSFQMIMMSKGMFLRGGLSIGSYYADDNIIFSKGLLNAYKLETEKAIYPRVVIDKEIVSKLITLNHNEIRKYCIDGYIVFDWESTSFFNPFGMTKDSFQAMQNLVNSVEIDGDDIFSKSMMSFSKNLLNNLGSFISLVSNDEKKEIENIKSKVYDSILKYFPDEKILSKYFWLLEFIKWVENDDSGLLKFELMSERLNQLESEQIKG